MSEASELEITPFWNDDLKTIHPAVGIVGDIAYIGVWVPCEVKDTKGHVTTRDLLYLVTSERQTIQASNPELLKRHWRLIYKPIQFKENRWLLSDVQAFLGGATVDPGEVFEELVNLYKEYNEMPDTRFYIFHALWTIGTYFHVLFNSFPYGYIGGVKRSGKTKILTVHSVVDWNAIFSNNMSSATLYRLIQNSRATLLIDESEKLSNPQRAQEFRNILLSGYKKGPLTYRCGKDAKERQVPEGYDVYAPKAIANISGLEDVLEDRCISQFQRRTTDKAIANKEIDILDPRYAKLRAQLCILFLQYWQEVSAAYAELSEHSELSELCERAKDTTGSEYMAGRELELWKPLYAIAEFFDHHPSIAHSQHSPSSLHSQMIELSCKLANERHTESITEVGEDLLIQFLLAIVPKEQLTSYVKVKRIKEAVQNQFEEKQEWLTTKWVGNVLRRLGFADKRRVGTGYEYSIPRKSLADLAERMQVEEPKEDVEQPSEDETPEPGVKSCFLCHMALPKDHINTTTLDGKEVHITCFRQQTEAS